MKLRFFILSFAVLSLITSCKEDKNAHVTTTQEIDTAESSPFKVELDITTDKKDDFGLYYTDDGTIAFNSDQVAWAGVKPGNQKVILTLPEGVIPTAIRLDLGQLKKEQQGNVTVQHFKMSYQGKDFEFKGSEFLTYFVKNDSIETLPHPETQSTEFKQNLKNNTTPFFYPHQKILDEVAKITK